MDTYIVAIVLIVAVMVYKLVNETVTRVTKERTKRVKEERKILELNVELERLKHQPPVDEPAAPLQEVEHARPLVGALPVHPPVAGASAVPVPHLVPVSYVLL